MNKSEPHSSQHIQIKKTQSSPVLKKKQRSLAGKHRFHRQTPRIEERNHKDEKAPSQSPGYLCALNSYQDNQARTNRLLQNYSAAAPLRRKTRKPLSRMPEISKSTMLGISVKYPHRNRNQEPRTWPWQTLTAEQEEHGRQRQLQRSPENQK